MGSLPVLQALPVFLRRTPYEKSKFPHTPEIRFFQQLVSLATPATPATPAKINTQIPSRNIAGLFLNLHLIEVRQFPVEPASRSGRWSCPKNNF
jgi:hypothetical protein